MARCLDKNYCKLKGSLVKQMKITKNGENRMWLGYGKDVAGIPPISDDNISTNY